MSYTTVSPEITLIPDEPPYEIVDEKEGKELVATLNAYLALVEEKCSIALMAKLDPLHDPVTAPGSLGGPDRAWSIEIVPTTHLPMYWFTDDKDWKIVRPFLDILFRQFKKHYHLVPFKIERKGRRRLYWPNGGCHIHRSINMFGESPAWYERTKLFHMNLLADFANRPYIRWLFAQPFSDRASSVLADEEAIRGKWAKPANDGSQFLGYNDAIRPRFMETCKALYPTFEFRFFSMVRNADELRRCIVFVDRWMVWHTHQVQAGVKIPFRLDMKGWRRLAGVRGSLAGLRDLFDTIQLDMKDYTPFIERNLKPRMRDGELV